MGLQTFGGLSLCLGLKVLVFVLSAVYPGITWGGLIGFTAFKKVFVLSADPATMGLQIVGLSASNIIIMYCEIDS